MSGQVSIVELDALATHLEDLYRDAPGPERSASNYAAREIRELIAKNS